MKKLEDAIKSAHHTARSFNTPCLVYRANNGQFMTGRESHYKFTKGCKPVCRVYPSGEHVDMDEFPSHCFAQKYRASKCPCGHEACTSWHVEPIAAIQGVCFSEEEAKAVADFMNRRFA